MSTEDYWEQALKMFPRLCARCGREFTGKNLRELTVHHKDHNHDNNPRDGSNWELLCLYCHDEEHMKYLDASRGLGGKRNSPATHKPFADLDALRLPLSNADQELDHERRQRR